mgnify:CR=1 FL=1
MSKLLPFILLILGIAAGTGAGIFFKAADEPCVEEPCDEKHSEAQSDDHKKEEPNYIRMKNQFVVPVVKDERVHSLVVLDLSLETKPGSEETIYKREPKIRDVFLRVLFDHAHIGGFDGTFTESGQLSLLRIALLEAAQTVVGEDVSDILITDIVRQEV